VERGGSGSPALDTVRDSAPRMAGVPLGLAAAVSHDGLWPVCAVIMLEDCGDHPPPIARGVLPVWATDGTVLITDGARRSVATLLTIA